MKYINIQEDTELHNLDSSELTALLCKSSKDTTRIQRISKRNQLLTEALDNAERLLWDKSAWANSATMPIRIRVEAKGYGKLVSSVKEFIEYLSASLDMSVDYYATVVCSPAKVMVLSRELPWDTVFIVREDESDDVHVWLKYDLPDAESLSMIAFICEDDNPNNQAVILCTPVFGMVQYVDMNKDPYVFVADKELTAPTDKHYFSK